MAKWSPGNRLVVLGAGATRGASWKTGGAEPSLCLPPLNADFFTQLQRLGAKKHESLVTAVLEDVVDIFGPNFRLTLEDYFSQLQSMLSLAAVVDRQNSSLWKKSEIAARRQRLVDAVAAVLEESADTVKRGSPASNGCVHHERVVKALEKKDTIISFNYDCVVDHALKSERPKSWNAEHGYGFGGKFSVVGCERWNGDDPPSGHNGSINLLKLHGSLNWFPFAPQDSEVRLRARTYNQHGRVKCEIIPPEQSKAIDVDPRFRQLWGHSELAIRKCKVVALIGFSFTPTDLHVAALFRGALRDNADLQRILIVNPSQDHRRHVRAVFHHPLQGGARVVQFDTFADFAPHAEQLLGELP